jgi:hypothetical protein
MTTFEYYKLVSEHMRKYPNQRKGQAMFNVAWDYLGESLSGLYGTDKDPFYKDDNIARFVEFLSVGGFFSDLTPQA